MYPILETEKLLLKPLQESDLGNMYVLYTNPTVAATMEHWDSICSHEKYQKEFLNIVASGSYFTIRLKENDCFIGFIQLYQYVKYVKMNKINHSQISAAILPEYWNCGYCTEATKKLLHFAFTIIKTPWLCANQFQDNPAAGKVLRNCGLKFHTKYKMRKRLYDQYRYTRADYLKDNKITVEEANEAGYVFSIKKSPYNYDNPIRKIDSITYIEQPTEYLCGQSVIAMLAGVLVDEVIDVMQNEQGTSTPEICSLLKWYGIKTATKAKLKYNPGQVLPDCCILSVMMPGYGHWSLYYKGKYFDPEFGVLDKMPEQAKLRYYWEVLTR